MARMLACCAVAAFGHLASASVGVGATPQRDGSLLQTWSAALDGTAAGAADTPVTRVVKLLQQMQGTLQKDMDEDVALHDKLACWCNNNEYEKDTAISAAQAKVADLQSTIDGAAARADQLKTSIAQLESEVSADKQALAEATALREKQLQEFHAMEVDSIQAIENLKAAITVLSKHHNGAFPQMPVSLMSIGHQDEPWTAGTEGANMMQALDDFMSQNGFSTKATDIGVVAPHSRFLQKGKEEQAQAASSDAATSSGWSPSDVALVQRALKSASVFMEAHHREGYYPAYSARSGEIMGVLQQLKEEMEADLSEAQKQETARAGTFAELRAAKTAEIESGERMAEEKEDALAATHNALASAKDDLSKTQASLTEDQQFVANLKKTCADADKNFLERKNARLAEIQAVSETIQILTADEARDAMSGTYSFAQVRATRTRRDTQRRQRAAAAIRRVAMRTHSPELSVLASSVELDAFGKVKQSIQDMISVLKVQQEDEVKKNDWCKAELHGNELDSTKTQDLKVQLETKVGALTSTIQSLDEAVANAHARIEQLYVDLQQASQNRQKDNLDFQKTVADQTVTVEVLKKALDRLAKFYQQQSLVQVHRKGQAAAGQTPPVPQAEYTPSQGSAGVMAMLQKLIQEAHGLIAEANRAEVDAQAAYEATVADTNALVGTLQAEIVSKTQEKASATKQKLRTEADLADAVQELFGLSEYNGQLHKECDYLLKNFGVRQEARAQEVEALQQAIQILSGAALQ